MVHQLFLRCIFSAVFAFAISSALAQSPLVFEGSENQKTITPNREKITVAGNMNQFLILGQCSVLVVTGNANTIKVQAVDEIVITGTGNKIKWSAGVNNPIPVIKDQGKSNTIESGAVSADDA